MLCTCSITSSSKSSGRGSACDFLQAKVEKPSACVSLCWAEDKGPVLTSPYLSAWATHRSGFFLFPAERSSWSGLAIDKKAFKGEKKQLSQPTAAFSALPAFKGARAKRATPEGGGAGRSLSRVPISAEPPPPNSTIDRTPERKRRKV